MTTCQIPFWVLSKHSLMSPSQWPRDAGAIIIMFKRWGNWGGAFKLRTQMAEPESSSIPVGHRGLQKPPLLCGGIRRRLAQGLQWDVTREARQGLIEGQSAVRGYTAPVSVRWRGEMEPYPWAMAAILASLCIILGIPSLSPLLDHLLHGSHICLFLSGPPSF